jgi:hypothetical protein
MTCRMTGNPLFGPDWVGVPRAEGATFVPAPVGAECWVCGEAVQAHDTGELMGGVRADGSAEGLVAHRGCMLLQTCGHVFGYCNCTGYQGLTRYQAGVALAAKLDGMADDQVWDRVADDG